MRSSACSLPHPAVAALLPADPVAVAQRHADRVLGVLAGSAWREPRGPSPSAPVALRHRPRPAVASTGSDRPARELLAPVYGRFTEGFDTAELQTAKTLLDRLG